ncbi:membrane protein [Marinosulfonomonas sp. PRT-SC04]|nr:membrane protein [Marinosulfonomonas sp. PRT-SC04]
MIAFAANSILNRLALVDGVMGPAGFALIRLMAGAVTLAALKWARDKTQSSQIRAPKRAGIQGALGAGSLALYVLGFSFAYVSLPAGVGALILFGGVQLTMFTGAVVLRDPVPPRRIFGAALAFSGLIWLLWPGGGNTPPLAGSLLMAAAALGWGIYSLLGRGAVDALAVSALNFALATPLGLLVFAVFPDQITGYGIVLAILSGGITSGLGYALWYQILPQLGATRAAVAQLSVPLMAMAGGMLFLAEAISLRFAIAGLLVMTGVWVSMRSGKPR